MGAGSFVTIKTRLGDANVMYEELRVKRVARGGLELTDAKQHLTSIAQHMSWTHVLFLMRANRVRFKEWLVSHTGYKGSGILVSAEASTRM